MTNMNEILKIWLLHLGLGGMTWVRIRQYPFLNFSLHVPNKSVFSSGICFIFHQGPLIISCPLFVIFEIMKVIWVIIISFREQMWYQVVELA